MKNSNTHSLWNNTWLSGAAGSMAVFGLAIWYSSTNALRDGATFFGFEVASNRTEACLLALLFCSGVMVLVEFFRQNRSSKLFNVNPNQGINFYADCLVFYIQTLILLFAIKLFYQSAGEYGFRNRSAFYQPWFHALELFTHWYYILGLPYIIITRKLKYDEEADKQRYSLLVGKIAMLALSKIPFLKDKKPEFGADDKNIFLAMLMQLFFLPLVIVFFYRAFPQLVDTLSYITQGMSRSFTDKGFVHSAFNRDLAQIGISFLFAAHLVVLFTSYAFCSRWINNQKQKVDNTLLSWVVCLVVFPPFTHTLITSWVDAMIGPVMQGPPQVITEFGSQTLVTVLIAAMLAFYLAFLVSTITLGTSYANLCYRKLITNGVYRWVRHPVYASKLLALSCFVLPIAILNAFDGNWETASSLTGGLSIGYVLFALRAYREEKWLCQHCDYQAYMKRVRYRFIPGVF